MTKQVHGVTADGFCGTSQKTKVAIAAIVKNESPYLIEWIAWHRLMGVTEFYICDNESDDGTTFLLGKLQDAGIINHILFPNPPDGAPQLAAYSHLIKEFGNKSDWLAFIDADEFIHQTENVTLLRFLDNQPAEVGGIAMNWSVFGSSGLVNPGQGLVQERFTGRALKDSGVNKHYKSIVRASAVCRTSTNPHHFVLAENYIYVNSQGKPLEFDSRGPGLSKNVNWRNFKLKHYVIKSWIEFSAKKAARGRATVSSFRDRKFFLNHDLNNESEAFASELSVALHSEINSIIKIIGEGANESLDSKWFGFTEEVQVHKKNSLGSIDRVEVSEEGIEVSGWALTDDLKELSEFEVVVGKERFRISKPMRLQRSDVVRAIPNSTLRSGFMFEVNGTFVEKSTGGEITVYPIDQSGAYCRPLKKAIFNLPSASIFQKNKNRTIELQLSKPANIGNAMFQYAFLRELQRRVPNSRISGFDIEIFGLKSTRTPLSGRVLEVTSGHQHSLDSLAYNLNSRIYDNLKFSGYVQRMEHFPNKEIFSSYFPRKSLDRVPSIGVSKLLINIRAAEILTNLHPDYGPLPISYFRYLVEKTGLEPVFMGQIGKDFYSTALLKEFAGCEFLPHISPAIDFETIRQASHIAVSVSTFSWLAAWLSDVAQVIHIPLKGLFNPNQRPDIDLIPIDDARYRFYRFPVEHWKATEPQLANLLSACSEFEEVPRRYVRDLLRYA